MRPKLPPGIEDRKADIWEPLLIVAACDGRDGSDGCDPLGRWLSRIEQAALASLREQDDTDISEGTLILGDIRDIYRNTDSSIKIYNNNISTADILTVAYRNRERPWGELHYGEMYLDDRRLAKLLRPYGVASEDGENRTGSEGYREGL
jgi:hypothetical protein